MVCIFCCSYIAILEACCQKTLKIDNCIYVAVLSKLLHRKINKIKYNHKLPTCTVSPAWMYRPVEDMTVIENYTEESRSVLCPNLVWLGFFGALYVACAKLLILSGI